VGPSPAGTAGKLVAFEGIDGSGKSTVLARVVETLRQEGMDLVATREETATPTGDWVKRSIAERWDPLATTFLFVADRVRHSKEIQAWRQAGSHVLCDRYLHSTYAYQSVTLGERIGEPLAFLQALHEPWCPLPDRVLLFTCDPELAVRRIQGRPTKTPYEKSAFLGRVQEAYLALARRDGGRFTVLDSDRHLDAVVAEAVTVVRGLLA
jgi:dTMP kinase